MFGGLPRSSCQVGRKANDNGLVEGWKLQVAAGSEVGHRGRDDDRHQAACFLPGRVSGTVVLQWADRRRCSLCIFLMCSIRIAHARFQKPN